MPRKITRVNIVCQKCGKKFSVNKFREKTKYCSHKCYSDTKKGSLPTENQLKYWERMKGRELPKETTNKMSETQKRIGNRPPSFENEKHPMWKEEGVSYAGLHMWVRRHFGSPMVCEHCGLVAKTKYNIHWANTDHKYTREREKWIRLCVSCHRKYDYAMSSNYKSVI